MSSPAQPRPGGGDRKGGGGGGGGGGAKGLAKVLSKVKTVLKRGESSKPRSSMPAMPAETPVKEVPAAESKPAPLSKAAEACARYEAMEGVAKVARAQLLEDRAKKLAERYGLDIQASDWFRAAPGESVLRIDKPIRMRVRRECHRCNATFAAAKECPSCAHRRCTKCPRYPPRRSEADKLASRERREAILKASKENPPIVADYSYSDKDIVLKRPSKTGGQDLYHRKARQRVRRTCHECQALFIVGSKKCQECGHIRCTDCPRDPAKKDRYPFGYPGDAFGSSSIPRYECDRCQTLYPLDAGHGTPCKKCGRHKSDASPRALPRKVDPDPDPEVLRMLQARLNELKVA